MNKLLSFFAIILIASTSFFSCSTPVATPDEVAKQYFEAFLVEDYITMHALSTEKERAKYAKDMLEEGAKARYPEKQEFLDPFKQAECNYTSIMDTANSTKSIVKIVFEFPEGIQGYCDSLFVKMETEEELWKVNGFAFSGN